MSEAQTDDGTNHTYAKLAILSEAAKRLRDDWDKLSYEDREKHWWLVHKASRDVWNILHPPREQGGRRAGKSKSIEDAVNVILKDQFKGGTL